MKYFKHYLYYLREIFLLTANNNDADQTAWMNRLICVIFLHYNLHSSNNVV